MNERMSTILLKLMDTDAETNFFLYIVANSFE